MLHSLIRSPLGDVLVLREEAGAITGIYLATDRRAVVPGPLSRRDDDAFDDVRRQLGEYFAGTRQRFDLPLHPTGTAFQQRVWQALTTIDYGDTASYGAVADRLGTPTASRAVGLANGRNPISIVVPCHRVVGANGSLTGYAGGLAAKQWLLAHEAAHAGLFAPSPA